jgi:hypothetical protein
LRLRNEFPAAAFVRARSGYDGSPAARPWPPSGAVATGGKYP